MADNNITNTGENETKKNGTQTTGKKKNAVRENGKKERIQRGEPQGFIRSVPLILFAFAIFITLCFITGETGAFGAFISKFLKGLFSYMAYTIPVFLTIHAITFTNDYKNRKILSHSIFSIITLITLAMVAFIIPNLSKDVVYSASEFYNSGIANAGGGFIGGSVAYALTKLFGYWGLLIIIALIFAVYIISFFWGKDGSIGKFLLKRLAAAFNFGAKLEKKSEEKKKKNDEPDIVIIDIVPEEKEN